MEVCSTEMLGTAYGKIKRVNGKNSNSTGTDMIIGWEIHVRGNIPVVVI
jgi:hypothetical protein